MSEPDSMSETSTGYVNLSPKQYKTRPRNKKQTQQGLSGKASPSTCEAQHLITYPVVFPHQKTEEEGKKGYQATSTLPVT